MIVNFSTKDATCNESPGTFHDDAHLKLVFKGSQADMQRIKKAIEKAISKKGTL